jgi:pilus assembly protein Flp/PilA
MGRRLDEGQSMRSRLGKLLRDTRGATAVEYGMIAALVVLGAFLGFRNFANTSISMWNNVSTTVSKS